MKDSLNSCKQEIQKMTDNQKRMEMEEKVKQLMNLLEGNGVG